MSEQKATTFLQSMLTRLRRDLAQELHAVYLIGSRNKRLLVALMLVLVGFIVYLSPFTFST